MQRAPANGGQVGLAAAVDPTTAEVRIIFTRKTSRLEVMEAVLPLIAKTTAASDGTDEGTTCVHDKVQIMHGWLAVMLVLLRPLMRAHLRKRDPELQLCPQLGPFNDKSEVFSVSRLRVMFQYVGKHFVGLPHWGYNIGRSSHATTSTMVAMSREEGVDVPWLRRRFALARMGDAQRVGVYSQAQARIAMADPNSIDARNHGQWQSLHAMDKQNGGATAASGVTPAANVAPTAPSASPVALPVSLAAPALESCTMGERLRFMELELENNKVKLAMKEEDNEKERLR